MTLTLTAINDKYAANNANVVKTTYWNVSATNPYTTGGELLTDLSGVCNHSILGGICVQTGANVAENLAGIAASAQISADYATSTCLTTSTTAKLKLWNITLGGATGGTWVDNTVANISGMTFVLRVEST